MNSIPVIALTGYLGAGKTSLLNHVLKTPGARIGVVINDFGELNVDAALVTGQVDEPASITGGCICCLPDDGGLDDALAKLSEPRLGLDAIIVEASGLADPVAIARIIGFSELKRIRPGGVVDVVDAAAHFDTVDRGGIAPARYGAASLIVVNKLDRAPDALPAIEARIRERNPQAHVVGVIGGRVDPTLLYDVAGDVSGQLSFRELLVEEAHHHVHAESVTAVGDGAVDPDALLDLLDNPPAGVYRLKGVVAIRQHTRTRAFVVNVVGPQVHLAPAPKSARPNFLVAIGTSLATDAKSRLDKALQPCTEPSTEHAQRRIQRYLG